MRVKINGKQETLNEGTTISHLLSTKKIRPEVVTVELNRHIIGRQDYTSILKEGDVVEFVFYMGGGSIWVL